MAGFYGDFVVPTMLAQPSDLAAWTQTPAPDNAVILLRWATTCVIDATAAAYYAADPVTGLATDAQILTAMKNMTTIQASTAAAIGFDPLTGVLTPAVASSKKIGTASIVYADSALAAAIREAVTNGDLVPEAEKVGRINNLLIPSPWTFG
jgi:hypothetical protein